MSKTTLQNQYNTLIEEYQALSLNKDYNSDITLECHHILPTALGGSDELENKVILPAKVHYKAHKLLAKLGTKEMISAFWFMSHKNTNSARGVKVSAEEYEEARQMHSEAMKGNQNSAGHKHTPEARLKMRIAKKGKKGHKMSEEQKIKLRARNRREKCVTYDHTIYVLEHKDGTIFTGTQYDFRVEYKLDGGNVSKVVRGTRKTTGGWRLVKGN